jgi:hypothetical protein
MDPFTVTVLSTLASVINYLYAASEKVQQNREECRRLATHTDVVLKLIKGEIDRGVSPALLERLHSLKR